MRNRCTDHRIDLFVAPSTTGAADHWLSLGQNRVRRAFRELAESLKDVLLDSDDDADQKESPATPLPPLVYADFAMAFRPVVDQVLRQVVERINEVPDARSAGSCEAPVAELLAGLLGAAVELGWALRVEAAEARDDIPRPQGAWAWKYRQMLASEGRWPPLG